MQQSKSITDLKHYLHGDCNGEKIERWTSLREFHFDAKKGALLAQIILKDARDAGWIMHHCSVGSQYSAVVQLDLQSGLDPGQIAAKKASSMRVEENYGLGMEE